MYSFTWSVKECFGGGEQREFTIRALNEHVGRLKLLEFIQLHNMMYQRYNTMRVAQQMWQEAKCVCAKNPYLCLKCFVRGDMQKEQERVEQLRQTLVGIIMHNFVQFSTTTPWWVQHQHGNPPVLNPYTNSVMGLQDYILNTAAVMNI
jgi:hypothetical protein